MRGNRQKARERTASYAVLHAYEGPLKGWQHALVSTHLAVLSLGREVPWAGLISGAYMQVPVWQHDERHCHPGWRRCTPEPCLGYHQGIQDPLRLNNV